MSDSTWKLPRWAWGLVALALAGLAVYGLRQALTPVLAAFLIAYFLDPLVDRFEKRGVPRALAIVIVLALTLGAFALVALIVVPGVLREVREFAGELPHRWERVRGVVEPWLAQYGIEVPHSLDELRQLAQSLFEDARTGDEGGELASQATSALGALGRWVLGGTASLVAIVGTLVIVPVFAFYLLYDFDRMTTGIRDLVPWRYRPFVVDVAREVDQVLGQFVRGQLLVMLILAVLYAVAYSIVGIRLAIPIGIVAGLLSFIPYVGGASALVLALLMCALGWQGWWQVIGVLIGYGVIQLLEGFVITPRIVGDKVGLPAVWVLLALMIGGDLFGFAGVLLAVPAAAVAKIFVVRAVAYYRKTPLFEDGAPAGAMAAVLAQEGLPDDAETTAAKAAAEPEREPEPSDEPEDVASDEPEDVASDEPEDVASDEHEPEASDEPHEPEASDEPHEPASDEPDEERAHEPPPDEATDDDRGDA